MGSALALVAFLLANGCDSFNGDSRHLRSLLGSRQSLKVATISGPFSYQKVSGERQGLEADLVQNFATSAKLKVEWVVFKNSNEALSSVAKGESDLAALHRSGNMKRALWAGPAYDDAQIVIVCPEAKLKQVIVSEAHDSPQLRFELALQGWNIVSSSALPISQLFKAGLKDKKPFCLATEENEARYQMRFFNEYSISSKVKYSQALRFWLSRKDPKLLQALFYWNQKISRDQTLSRIRENYERPLTTLTTSDLELFYSSKTSRFSEFAPFFKESAKDHHLPWQLVAAVSFQESHWDFQARSHTGVRGLMQLTEEAAEHMGINDRKDPEQNVWGGTKYLKYLFQYQPTHLPFRQRLALTLAAYNIGQGHLLDAQKLAVRLGKNPYAWLDLRQILPLLANERWSKDLEYGPARGSEAVQFSERTLAYFDLLLDGH